MSNQRHQEEGQSTQVKSQHQARLPEEEEQAEDAALGNLQFWHFITKEWQLLDTRAKQAADSQETNNTEAGKRSHQADKWEESPFIILVTFFKKLGSPF